MKDEQIMKIEQAQPTLSMRDQLQEAESALEIAQRTLLEQKDTIDRLHKQLESIVGEHNSMMRHRDELQMSVNRQHNELQRAYTRLASVENALCTMCGLMAEYMKPENEQ